MKSIKKLLFVMAALAAVFGFVACSDDDDDGPATVAVYELSVTGTGYSETLTLFDNGTFENVRTVNGKNYTVATGTYDGDVKKDTSGDNKVTFTVKKMAIADTSTGEPKLVSIEDYVENLPGVSADYFKDMEAIISGDTLTCDLGIFTLKE